jgi:hypothetical protein
VKSLFLPSSNSNHSRYQTEQKIAFYLKIVVAIHFVFFLVELVTSFISLLMSLIKRESLGPDYNFLVNLVYAVVNIKYFVDYTRLYLKDSIWQGRKP